MGAYRLRRCLTVALSCIVVFATTYANPVKMYKNTYNPVSDEEIRLLPEYLQVKVYYYLGVRPEAISNKVNEYLKKLGVPVYNPLHHYGLGLIYLRRARMQAAYPVRRFDIDSAISEFTFVITNSPSESFVLYDVYCKRGEAHMFANDLPNATKDFRKSIELKPDLQNAYLLLSECYTRIGDLKSADAIIELGRTRSRQTNKQ